MPRPSTLVRKWLQNATTQEARAMAEAAKTSVAHLRHIAAGRRGVSADLAQRLAHASGRIGHNPLLQQALCVACSVCPLVRPLRA